VIGLLVSAAYAGDVVLALPWGKREGNPDAIERVAARALGVTPTVVSVGDGLGHRIEIVDRLVTDPDPTPELLWYLAEALAAEQAARPDDTLYVAVPYRAHERQLWLWRWDAARGRLVRAG
jgi:hypothetical protein